MPYTKKHCPECEDRLYEFYGQTVCIECGYRGPCERPFPTSEEAVEIIHALLSHHIGKVRRARHGQRHVPGFCKHPADEARFHNKMEDEIEVHGKFAIQLETAQYMLEKAATREDRIKRLERQLQEKTEELAFNEEYARRWFG